MSGTRAFVTAASQACGPDFCLTDVNNTRATARLGYLGSIKLPLVAALALASCLLSLSLPAIAQSRLSDAGADAQDLRLDALMALPNRQTPGPQDNAIATTPGLEQLTPTPRFTVNLLAPIYFNSNAEEIGSGGTAGAEGSPEIRLSGAGQLGNLPIRLSGSANVEWDRFASAPDADFDKIRPNLSAQYVSPDNDQAYSPYISFGSRLDFDPTFATRFATRYDLNVGVNKVFNFDGDFRRVAFSNDSSASTVWSLGFNAGVQRRWRDPSPSSYAVFFIPSASYVISNQWSAEALLDITQRWYDLGPEQELTVEPIAVLEYVVPDRWLGGPNTARWFGRPAIDFQAAYVRNWANIPGFTYSQWVVGVAFRTGWRF